MKKAWVLSYQLSAQWKLWSDWADAQADLSLRWAHSHFVRFVMSRLILKNHWVWEGVYREQRDFQQNITRIVKPHAIPDFEK